MEVCALLRAIFVLDLNFDKQRQNVETFCHLLFPKMLLLKENMTKERLGPKSFELYLVLTQNVNV